MEEEGSRKFEIPPLPSRFGNIPDIWEKSKDDFSDDELAGKTAIRLVQLSNEEICEMGEKVMRSVQSGVSRKSTATLFLLAYQLKSPGVGNTKRVFPKADPKENIFDLEISSFDDKVVGFPGGPTTVKRGSNSAENAKAYAYLAASFLRLFAKSPEIFCDAWSRIIRGYKTFYSSECPLETYPNINVLKVIHAQFSLDDVFKTTLYRILYMSSSEKGNEGIVGTGR